MKISQAGVDLIKSFEGLAKLSKTDDLVHAYPDPATGGEPWTIGFGNTTFIDGRKVKKGDVISKEEAEFMLRYSIDNTYGKAINDLVISQINQCQYDAMCSLTYNIGVGNFKKSSVLKKVNVDPNDPTIRNSWNLWNKANGKVMAGLTKRRAREADVYFTPVQKIESVSAPTSLTTPTPPIVNKSWFKRLFC